MPFDRTSWEDALEKVLTNNGFAQKEKDMTPEQINSLMDRYILTLLDMGYGETDPEKYKNDKNKALYQASACSFQVKQWMKELMTGQGPVTGQDKRQRWSKIHRWIGFIQGVLWVEGIYTIDEMGEHNRGKES